MSEHGAEDIPMESPFSRPTEISSKLKPQPQKSRRPGGVSQELFDLVGGIPSIPVTEERPIFREKLQFGKTQKKWVWKETPKEARPDGLTFHHWSREGGDEDTDVTMAEAKAKPKRKYEVVEYTDAEYESLTPQTGWGLPETDYLFGLCRQFDLRWPVIWDRYEWKGEGEPGQDQDQEGGGGEGTLTQEREPRSMEDIKERYYYVARRVLRSRNLPTEGMQYDRRRERERKDALDRLFHQTQEEREKEEALAGELRRFQHQRKRLEREQAQIRQILQQRPIPPAISNLTTHSTAGVTKKRRMNKKEQSAAGGDNSDSTVASVATPAGHTPTPKKASTPTLTSPGPNAPKKDKLPAGVVQRSARIPIARGGQNTLIKASACMRELAVGLRPVMATAGTCEAYERLQSGVLEMLELKKLRDRMLHERRLAETRLVELRRGDKSGLSGSGKRATGKGDPHALGPGKKQGRK